MADLLLGTGAELRLPRRALDETEDPAAMDEKANEIFVEVQVFADLEEDERRYRVGGTVRRGDAVSLSGDPTTSLLEIAHDARSTRRRSILSWRRTYASASKARGAAVRLTDVPVKARLSLR